MISVKKKLSLISQIYDRDGTKCWYCQKQLLELEQIEKSGTGIPDDYPTIEHVIPAVIGGGDALANLRASCAPCNNAKDYELPLEMIEGMDLKEIRGLLRTMVGKNMALVVENKTLKSSIKATNARARGKKAK